MDKIKLESVLYEFNGDYNDLYEKINVIDKESTDFNYLYYNEIVYLCMFLYHIKYGIESLSKNGIIPKLFSNVNSYDEFKKMLDEYKKIEFHNDLLPNEKNMFQEIWRLAESKLLSRDSWTKVYSSSIYKKDVQEDGKLYISIDNKDLYQFACLLISKSLKAGIKNFEFKLNNNPTINRRDNVVIYFTTENLNQYLMVINQILKDNPNIQINDEHLLGYTLKSGISLAKDYADGSSFTEKVCNTIIKMKERKYSDSQITDLVDDAITMHLSDFLKVIDKQVTLRK